MKKKIIIMTAVVSQAALLAGCSHKAATTSVTDTISPTATVESTLKPGGANGQAPNGGEKPEGTPPAGEKPDGTPPAGEKPDGTPPADLGGNGGPGGQNAESVTTTGVQTIDGETKTLNGGSETSNGADESVFKVTNKGSLILTNYTLTKAGGEISSTEASDFYGAGSGILTSEGASTTIKDSTVTTDAKGGNAVFATGEGSNVTLDNVTITTSKNNSRGLDATYSGMISANKVKITTKGAHCAAVATDRGEGTVTVADSILNTSGEGSPCIYSTGKITATGSTGEASGSIIAAVEGKNSISIKSCQLSGSGQGRANGGIDDSGVMIYQSMSGDAGEGTGNFTSEDSTLSIQKSSSKYKTSPMFFVTNTDAEISLTNTKLVFGSGVLLNAAGNSGEWGNSGSNGGNVAMTANNQALEGAVTADAESTVSLTLTKSTLKSTVNGDNKAKSMQVTIDQESTWELMGDSYVSAFADEDTSMANIKSNGHTVYYDATNSANAWLSGKTIRLADGGSVAPSK